MKQPQQDGHDGQQHLSKKKRRVGAALSLDKFAKSGVSKYDKKFAMEKLKKEKLIRYSKLSKIRHKMEGQGALPASRQLVVRDAIAEMEALDNPVPGHSGRNEADASTSGASAAENGPANQRQSHAQHGGQRGTKDAQTVPQQHADRTRTKPQEGDSGGAPAEPGGKGKKAKGQGLGKDVVGGQGGGGSKPRGRLQRLAEEVKAKKAAERQAKEAEHKARVEKEHRLVASKKHRAQEKHDFFRRTAKGQPVMKYRMQKILDQLEAK